MTHAEFSEKYRHLMPSEPGVYRYLSESKEILYIGKAKDLKKRVSSYFTKTDHSRRIERLVHLIHDIEITIVNTEQDAFLLENSLIKKHQPRYNVMLKDDKTYPFIVIKKEEFPRVFITRLHLRDGSEYLGPYTAGAHHVMHLLADIFPIRDCSLSLTPKNIAAKKFKTCLKFHIKKCLGPCEAHQSADEYQEMIEQIREILKSNFGSVQFYFKKKMQEFAENLDFERAEEIRQRLASLTDYQSKSTIVNPKINNLDVYGFAEYKEVAYITYFKIANGTIIQTRAIEIKRILEETKEELLQAAMSEYSFNGHENLEEIIIPFEVESPFESIKICVPLIGDKKKLLDLATKNSLYIKQEKINQSMTQEEKNPSFRIMKKLKDDLKLTEMPKHIECFDNSNFQGTNAVSSIVVFKDAKPSKKDYRFFNVKTVVGPDDFATMEEAVYRRYKRMLEELQPLPQLIIIDGGKGQLSAAVKSLEKLNIYGKVPIIGIAKRLEEIYFPNDTLPLYINKMSESLKLIQRLRDEAHRFGITAHRNKRSKNFTNSELISIEGIGEKTLEILLKHFKSVKKLKAAKLEEIKELVGEYRAKILVQYFEEKSANEISEKDTTA